MKRQPFPDGPSSAPPAPVAAVGGRGPRSPSPALLGTFHEKSMAGTASPEASLHFRLVYGVCVCGEEPGAEGGLGVEATSFYCGWGFFYFFFLKIDLSPSLFLGDEHYFKPLGVSRSPCPNNSEALLERVDVKLCSISFPPATEGSGWQRGCCTGLITPLASSQRKMQTSHHL